MQSHHLKLLIISSVCCMAAFAAAVGLSSATIKQAKGSAPLITEKKGYKKDGTSTVAREERVRSQQRQQPEARSRSGNRRNRYPVTLGRKALPEAAIQPQFYGVLQDAHRYDPRLHHRAGSVRHPQTLELVQEHFLELDHNHDGKIDPMERVAFGRLDMDRDLQKYQP